MSVSLCLALTKIAGYSRQVLHLAATLCAVLTAPGAPVRTAVVPHDGGFATLTAAESLRSALAADDRLVVEARLLVPQPVGPVGAVALQTARAEVAAATQAYQRLEPQVALSHAAAAEEALRPWLDRVGAPQLLARSLRTRALTLLYLERRDEARQAFGAAALLDPDFSPAAAEWPPEARLLYADTGAAQKRAVAGALSVRVQPQAAAVWLDGVRVGDGPTTVRDVVAGSHYLLVECAGHERFAAVVEIDGGGKLNQASVFLEPLSPAEKQPAAAAALAMAWGRDNEGVLARQVAAVLDVAALVWVDDKEDTPRAWVLGADGARRGGYIALSESAAGSTLVAARIIGADSEVPMPVVEPWYLQWPTWVAAGAAVVVGGALTTYLIAGRSEPDRVTFYLGRR